MFWNAQHDQGVVENGQHAAGDEPVGDFLGGAGRHGDDADANAHVGHFRLDELVAQYLDAGSVLLQLGGRGRRSPQS